MSDSAPKLAGLIGHPVGHSLSPIIHGHWLKTYQINGHYVLMDVPPDTLPDAFKGLEALGFQGCNVTIPHKETAFALADRLSDKAKRLGVVNTLVVQRDGGLYGTTTDGDGFVHHLSQTIGEDLALSERRVLILGAGGAARSIVGALLDAGCTSITLCNRNQQRASDVCALASDHCHAAGWDSRHDQVSAADLIINTTSLGMVGQPALELDLGPASSTTVVSDIVYTPLETPLLQQASARGLRTADGLGMLLHQAVDGFEMWFGVRPEVTDTLRAAVLEALSRK